MKHLGDGQGLIFGDTQDARPEMAGMTAFECGLMCGFHSKWLSDFGVHDSPCGEYEVWLCRDCHSAGWGSLDDWRQYLKAFLPWNQIREDVYGRPCDW